MATRTFCLTAILSIILVGVLGCSKEETVTREVRKKRRPTTRPSGVPKIPEMLSMPEVGTDAIDDAHKAVARRLINGGLMYLLSSREPDGAWSMGDGLQKPAITAMVLKALLQHADFEATSPLVGHGFDELLTYRQEDGGIYDPKAGYANYNTSLAVMALAAARHPRYRNVLREAVAYLKGQQIVEGAAGPKGGTVAKGDPTIGGSSYGEHGRPDGSNAGMWAEALRDAGVPANDPGMQRMLGFFSRLQNHSESNEQAWVQDGPNDGGFVYALGESKAGAGPGGRGLRSYGSLTYVGFKSLLYSGLDKNDPRVRAAYDWIRRNWTLQNNPNMPQKQSLQGLYYYYHAYAKALRTWGEPVITDSSGAAHNWREELIDALGRRVREDGSWINEADRWNEGSGVLVTAYCVLSLQEALKK